MAEGDIWYVCVITPGLHCRGTAQAAWHEPCMEAGPLLRNAGLERKESAHEHQWVFVRTDSDWWDGDEDDVYHCSVNGCSAWERRYIPR